jgi:hypothetical protein
MSHGIMDYSLLLVIEKIKKIKGSKVDKAVIEE